MSDAFETWRKAQNPLKIGGPLDELLELAFDAGREAEGVRILSMLKLPGFPHKPEAHRLHVVSTGR